MKQLSFTLLLPLSLLLGCTSTSSSMNPPNPNQSYYCRKITREMHIESLQHHDASTTKPTPTYKAKLSQEYIHYGCHRNPPIRDIRVP